MNGQPPMSPLRRAVLLVATAGACVIAALNLIIGWRIALPPSTTVLGDMQVYVDALTNSPKQGGVYGYRTSTGLGFTYPPSAALLFIPLTWLAATPLHILWTLALLTSVALMGWVVTPRWLGRWRLAVATVATACLLQSVLVQSGLVAGNVSVILTALCLADVGHAVPVRWRGYLTGVTAAMKLTPLAFLPHFLLTRQRGTFVRAALAFVGLTVLAGVLRPHDTLTYWTETIVTRERIGDAAFTGNLSITGTLARLGVTGVTATACWMVVAVLALALGLRAARSSAASGDHVAAAIIMGCATVIASPVSWPFHAIWLPLAALVLLSRPSWGGRLTGAALLAVCILWPHLVRLLGPQILTELPIVGCLAIAAFGLVRAPDRSRS